MVITLSKDERDTLLIWKELSKKTADHFGGGEALFPEEERLASDLRAHAGGAFEIKEHLFPILLSWAESGVDPHFGGGAMTNPVEKKLLEKLKALEPDKGVPASPGIAAPPAKAPNFDSLDPEPTGKGAGKGKRWAIVILVAVLALAIHLYRNRNHQATAPLPKSPQAPLQVDYRVGDAAKKSADGWIPVQIGERVLLSDSLKTASASKVVLSGGGKRIEVGENRVLLVKDLF